LPSASRNILNGVFEVYPLNSGSSTALKKL
jgi:hypothetical protein